VLIALEYDQQGPVFGMIDQPYTGERFVGYGDTAWLNTMQGSVDLSTSQRQKLDDAILCSTFPEIGTRDEKQAFDQVSQRCKLIRYGLDCYAYALLAAGHIDLVIEAGLNAYDVQAPIAVIQAAGGVVTNWSGGPAHDGGQIIAAANPVLHRQAISFLQPYAVG
jgi:fructose-1,6-bisphosphatase/inositol monophosphatase family enzyme